MKFEHRSGAKLPGLVDVWPDSQAEFAGIGRIIELIGLGSGAIRKDLVYRFPKAFATNSGSTNEGSSVATKSFQHHGCG